MQMASMIIVKKVSSILKTCLYVEPASKEINGRVLSGVPRSLMMTKI